MNKAIIVDVDGTIAKNVSRGHFDWFKVDEDEPHQDIIDLVYLLWKNDHTVIIMSGRDEICYQKTESWIKKYFPEDFTFQLIMRRHRDNRKDSIIKKELYDTYVKDNYDVKYVIDDRNQVVDCWRNELGLRCLQVAEGNF